MNSRRGHVPGLALLSPHWGQENLRWASSVFGLGSDCDNDCIVGEYGRPGNEADTLTLEVLVRVVAAAAW